MQLHVAHHSLRVYKLPACHKGNIHPIILAQYGTAYLKVKVPKASTMQLHMAQRTMRSDSLRAAFGPDTAEVLWNRLAVMD
jgi:hypothetical protein